MTAKTKTVATLTGKNPLMVLKRILHREVNRLWGVLIQYQGKKYKMTREQLIDVIESEKRPVQVDFPGADIPVALTAVTLAGKKYFRTVWDTNAKGKAELRNNFNQVKACRIEAVEKIKIIKT